MRWVLGDKYAGDGGSWEQTVDGWMGCACFGRLWGEGDEGTGYELVVERLFEGVAL